MYVNFVNDRKKLGYKAVKDSSCGMQLVLITDSTVLTIRNFSLNLKSKSKRIVVVISSASVVWFSNLKSAEGIGLTMRSAPMERVQPSFEDSFKKPEFAKLIPRKSDRISYKYFYRSKEELLFFFYATDRRLASNQQILKLVKYLRRGIWGGGGVVL